jgi:protein-tyrosine phosphatase
LRGSLDRDIKSIVAWCPDIVVSMTEQSEMDRGGCGNLAPRFAAAAIAWFHLPIRDYGGPEGTSGEAWPGLAARLHDTLAKGGAVLLHCRGGQGRSGMIALRILVERGENVDSALERIRAVRPGAVETDAQIQWASRGAPGGT